MFCEVFVLFFVFCFEFEFATCVQRAEDDRVYYSLQETVNICIFSKEQKQNFLCPHQYALVSPTWELCLIRVSLPLLELFFFYLKRSLHFIQTSNITSPNHLPFTGISFMISNCHQAPGKAGQRGLLILTSEVAYMYFC